MMVLSADLERIGLYDARVLAGLQAKEPSPQKALVQAIRSLKFGVDTGRGAKSLH